MMYLFVFENTHDAIAGEQALLSANILATVVPLPSAIGSGCGICLRVSKNEMDQSLWTLKQHEIPSKTYEIIENGRKKTYHRYLMGPLTKALGVKDQDIISIVGCGGKTTCMYQIAKEQKEEKVMVTTTTHIMIPKEGELVDHIYNQEESQKLTKDTVTPGRYLIYGGFNEKGKCVALSYEELEALSKLFTITIMEADGSRCLPIKGYREYEPCTPPYATLTVGILPLKSLGQPLDDRTVHRVPEFCNMTGGNKGDMITLDHIGKIITHPDGMYKGTKGRKILFLNQLDDEGEIDQAKELLPYLSKEFLDSVDRIIAGSLQKEHYVTIYSHD